MVSERDLAASYRERVKQMRDLADTEADQKTASMLRKVAAQYDKMGDSLSDMDARRMTRLKS
jgi:DNA-binding ferritin-like protein